MKQQRILVEGNDFHVIVQVCIKHGLKRPVGFPNQKDFERDFLIKNKRGESLGKKDLLNEVPRVAKSAGVQTLGIVLDADKSANSTWQSVCAALQKSGYTNLPTIPDINGTIIIDTNPDLPKVGIWIMPDNQNSGEIEDFFLQLIDDEDFRLKRARKVISELIVEKPDFHLDANRSKAETHTWLAWQQEPGKSMGLAIKSNWVTDNRSANIFWVRLLFFLTPLTLPAQSDTTLPLPPVTIRDTRFDQTGFSAWRADSLPLSGAMNLSDRLLWENPVAVRANAPGTLATVSARGAGSSRTPVFWNGLNLQSPQNGVVDASLLPLWPGDRLEVRYGGQSAALSAGAMGGSILVEPNFLPEDGFSGTLGGGWGSFGRKDVQAALGFSQQNIAVQGRMSWQEADNDFPYKNTAQLGQPDVKQVNNGLEKLDIQQFNRFIFNEKNTVKTAFWHQRAFREIPPAMTEAPSETDQRDRSTRVVAAWEHSPDARTLWQTRAAYVDEAIFFNLRGDVDSSRARTALLNSEYAAVAGERLSWKACGTAIRQWAQADGYADTARWYGQTRLAGFGMAEWRLPNGRLTALLRQEWAEDLAAPFTWSLGGQLGWGKAGALRFHISRNFNLPTFNDRFWLEYGKTDLKPEKGYSGDVGWVFSSERLTSSETLSKSVFSAEITAFQLLLDDWILWQPGADGIFRPGNLRKVWSRGAEISSSWQLAVGSWQMKISGRYQYVKATNVEVYGGSEDVLKKQLPYTPNHNAGTGVKIEKAWFSAAYLHQWTGRCFTTSDNATVLDGFATGNLLLRIHPTPDPSPTGRGDVTCSVENTEGVAVYATSPLPVGEGPGVGWALDFRLENIWNTPYQIIAYRPMPGRSFRIGLTLSW